MRWLVCCIVCVGFARAVVPSSVLLDDLTVTDDIDPFPAAQYAVPAALPAVPWFALALVLLELVVVLNVCPWRGCPPCTCPARSPGQGRPPLPDTRLANPDYSP